MRDPASLAEARPRVGGRVLRLTGAALAQYANQNYFEEVTANWKDEHGWEYLLPVILKMQRFTRLTDGHSKKIEHHEHACALHFFHYNFCRIHQTLRCTPAMAAGITNKVWKLADIAGLFDITERLTA